MPAARARPEQGERRWSSGALLLVFSLLLGACGSSGGLTRHDVDGTTFFTHAPGAMGGVGLEGGFTIEQGCVVFANGNQKGLPIFIDGSRLSRDHQAVVTNRTSCPLTGLRVSTGGESLSEQQAHNLGFDAGDCRAYPFVFID